MQVFVDVDGVVADFDRHIMEVYGKPMADMNDQEKERFWETGCVAARFFANAPPIGEGVELVQQLLAAGIDVVFLTSTGGGIQHTAIAQQKLEFLHRIGFGALPVAFVTGTACKASFAGTGGILIDDRQKVVDAWQENGGIAYLFDRESWTGNSIAMFVRHTAARGHRVRYDPATRGLKASNTELAG